MAIGKVKRAFLGKLEDWGKTRVIRDYVEFCQENPKRRALLSYLVLPLLPPSPFRDRVKFSNRGIAQEIPRALNELGYSVDIVNFDNTSWLPDRSYDLFIGHGGINFEPISRRLSNGTVRIYFATGIYWREWNTRISQRASDFISRKGIKLSSNREIKNDEDYALLNSGGIICLGNSNAIQTYERFPNVIGINNAIYPLDHDVLKGKDFTEAKSHFLFFSGRGNVHKGLDVLLEAFTGTDLHLHVCQHLEPDFFKAYRQELTVFPNIHHHGFIRMRSSRFLSIAKRCGWIISPTCAEGQPGALLECMGHGLIPITSPEVNIDIGEWGISLSNCRIPSLRSTIHRARHFETEKVKNMAIKVKDVTQEVYSVKSFRDNIRKAISRIIDTS